MVTVAVCNQKGGVGKTSIVYALGAGLKSKGYRVLYVDLDMQGNLSYTLAADANGLSGRSSFEVLTGGAKAIEAIQPTEKGDIIASSPALAGADAVLLSTGKEYKLREALETLGGQYDVVLIDTPPSLGILTVNALAACNGCLIPAQADLYSLQGIGQLRLTLEAVKKYCNPSLKVYGIAITRWSARANFNKQLSTMMEDAAASLSSKLYKSRIREATANKEAQAMQTDIYSYAPRSGIASDYMNLVEEIEEQIKQEA